MKNCLVFFLFYVLTAIANIVIAQPRDRYLEKRDSLIHLLSYKTEWQQRKQVIEHLVDISMNNNEFYKYYSRLLFSEAQKAGDVSSMIESSINIINVNNNLSKDTLNKYMEIMEKAMKKDPRKEITLLFFNMRYDVLSHTTTSVGDRLNKLSELVGKFRNMGEEASIYDQVRVLNYICNCIQVAIPESDIFTSYMQRLNNLVEKLPYRESPVIPQFYISSAKSYTLLGKAEQAIFYDRKLLKHIKELETYYKKRGRDRNYDYYYYNTYRNMLSNFRALSREEIEKYYLEIKNISARNLTAYKDYYSNSNSLRVNLYYYYATGRYKKAASYADSLLVLNDPEVPRFYLLQYAIDIYKHLGNSNEHLMKLYEDYFAEIKEREEEGMVEKVQEAQVLYGIGELKTQNKQLHLQKENIAQSARSRLLILGCVVILILIILVINILLKYLDKKRYNLELQKEKEELLRIRDELILAKNKAEKSERLEALFLANVSHEIRTPLNSIVGFSKLLITASDNAERIEYEGIISENTEYLLRLVNDVLELSRLEAGKIDMEYTVFDLSGYLSTFAVTIREMLKNSKVKLKVQQPVKHYMVESDKERINQVFTNFAVNAIKYTSNGTITVGFEEEEGGIKIYVSDTGIGIKKSEHWRVFSRFDKIDSNVMGTGLGLSITKAIVENMGGRVGFESAYREGSTFWAWLPLQRINIPDEEVV